MRDVVFYGRVSSEKELQLSALQNQLQWYDDLGERHVGDWAIIGKYIDRGITGTAATKRPNFLKMLEDAKSGKFDLIVTREVARFARNTEETLHYVRKLKQCNVEVYFVNDNIWSFDPDGELRLTIMAGIAQEEARKDSERVKAGIYIARQKGVLWGNGNRYGYEKNDKGEFVLKEDEYRICRMIGEWYMSGKYGLRQIKKLLEKNHILNGHGSEKWEITAIRRIVSDPFYMGVQVQNKSKSDGYLTQRRVMVDKSEHIYVKGNYPVTFTAEEYKTMEKLRTKRRTNIDTTGKMFGKQSSDDLWFNKLRCGCGSRVKRYKWRVNKNTSEQVYGYTCWNQAINGRKSKREKEGMDTSGACDLVSTCQWKLDMMASLALEDLWVNKKEDTIKAYELIKKCYVSDLPDFTSEIKDIQNKIKKYEKRKSNLMRMRADGEIDKEEYTSGRNECDALIAGFEDRLKEIDKMNYQTENIDEKLESIKTGLDAMMDFSKSKLDYNLLEQILEVVVHKADYEYDMYLNLSNDDNDEMLEDDELAQVVVEKQWFKKPLKRKMLQTYIFSREIGFDEARTFRKRDGHYLRGNQWNDLKVNVYL